MEDEITYEKLVSIYREEKGSKPLTKLCSDFSEKVRAYLVEKKKIIEQSKNTDNMFSKDISSKARKELKNALRILKEIFYYRQTKILNQALLSVRTEAEIQDFEPMLEEEKKLFENIYDLLYKNMKVLTSVLNKNNGIKEEGKVLKGNMVKVRVIEKIIPFVWEDGRVYGPYKKNEEAQLPKKVAEILKQDNKVIII